MLKQSPLYFFSSMIKEVYLPMFHDLTIDSLDYKNQISKISLLSHNQTNKIKNSLEKNDSIHLMIIPKHPSINLTLKNITSDLCLNQSSLTELNLKLIDSTIGLIHKVSKDSLNLSCDLKKSKLKFNEIDALNNLKMNLHEESKVDISSLSTKTFKFSMTQKSKLNCYLLKIIDNSIINYCNDSRPSFFIHPFSLWTLINIYCSNKQKFVNLPLGVLGGKIGSTSFPTLILYNQSKTPGFLLESFHKSMIFDYQTKKRFGFIGIIILVGLIAILPINSINERYTKYKLNQHQLKTKLI